MPTPANRTTWDYIRYYVGWFCILINAVPVIFHLLNGLFGWFDVVSLAIVLLWVFLLMPQYAPKFMGMWAEKYKDNFWGWWLRAVAENMLTLVLLGIAAIMANGVVPYIAAFILIVILTHLLFRNYVY